MERRTGSRERGFVKFSDGDHSVGIWHKFQLMEGFHVEGPRKLEVVRSRTAMGYIQKGQPGMANLVDREWGCANEHESMGLWAEAAGRMPDSGDSDFTDDLLLDWRASKHGLSSILPPTTEVHHVTVVRVTRHIKTNQDWLMQVLV